MDWTGWYTIAVVAVGVLIMARDILGADFAMMGILVALMLPGERVLSLENGLSGFSNTGVLTVGILFVMAAGISETGGLDYIFTQFLGTPSSSRGALIRMMFPLAIISAFMNNTPVVAIMIPIVLAWCRKAGLPPGHLFIPLSFASILGGTITLIGTSTNLVVAGKQQEQFPDEPAIGIFDLALYGVPVALAGIIYIILFAPRLLPGADKKARKGEDADIEDAFLVGLQVLHGSAVAGRSVGEAGLRGLQGLYLTSVRRGGTVIHAVGPDFIIACGDVLFFAGELSQVRAVTQRFNLRVVADAFEEDLPALMGSPRTLQTAEATPFVCGRPSDDSAMADAATTPDHHSADQDQALLHGASTSTGGRYSPHGLHRQSVLPPANLFRATVRPDAPDLLNVTVRDAHFRSNFQAAIVAIRRAGVKLDGKLGDVELRAGDALLLDAGAAFDEASDAVQRNLSGIELEDAAEEREFMFAFEVVERGGKRVTGDATNNGGDGSVPRSSSTASLGDAAGGVFKQLRQGGGNLVGKSIEAAGLRGLPDVFLVTIERGAETLHAVAPSEVLRAGDVLWFAGSTDGVISLRKIPGLKQIDDQIEKLSMNVLERRLVQVVLARTSALLGKTVRETRFRTRFDAAIVALHRAGQRLRTRIGDIELAAGDVLLLDTGAHFLQNFRKDRNFALVAEVADSRPPRFDRVAIAVAAAVAAIAVAIAGKVELFTGAAVASAVMLLAGCLSGEQARRAVKWDVLVTIAAAFGISNAMEGTGAAKAIADLLVSLGEKMGGDEAIQVSVYVATVLLSNIVANNAAAALMYPIAASIAIDRGIDKNLMSYLLMLAASASFAVPFGYQTNLMVYGAGGYKFTDFLRFGGPMQLWQGAASVAVILLAEFWHAVWAFAFVATALVVLGPTLWGCYTRRRGARRGAAAAYPASERGAAIARADKRSGSLPRTPQSSGGGAASAQRRQAAATTATQDISERV